MPATPFVFGAMDPRRGANGMTPENAGTPPCKLRVQHPVFRGRVNYEPAQQGRCKLDSCAVTYGCVNMSLAAACFAGAPIKACTCCLG